MRGADHENAVGNLVLHLCGNVRQWIGPGVAGKPDIRVRDREFQARGDVEPAELAERITVVVDDAIEIILALDEGALLRVVQIQSFKLTVLEAVMHVLEHFGQHTGQIILLTKHASGEDLGFYRNLTAAVAGGTP
jgi:hypothetical protein